MSVYTVSNLIADEMLFPYDLLDILYKYNLYIEDNFTFEPTDGILQYVIVLGYEGIDIDDWRLEICSKDDTLNDFIDSLKKTIDWWDCNAMSKELRNVIPQLIEMLKEITLKVNQCDEMGNALILQY